MKKKSTKAKKPLPRSLPIAKAREWCESRGIDPDSLITSSDRMWEWAVLRKHLQDNVALLDARFSQLAEKRKICPIVLLLDGGPIE